MNKCKGFTLIEIMVVIAIISLLSTIILFSLSLYINKGKDSSVKGNLAVLMPAGEAYYNIDNTYESFCSSPAVTNIIAQLPENSQSNCTSNSAGLCCNVASQGDAWMACAPLFASSLSAFCVDSRGLKGLIDKSSCVAGAANTSCPF